MLCDVRHTISPRFRMPALVSAIVGTSSAMYFRSRRKDRPVIDHLRSNGNSRSTPIRLSTREIVTIE